MSTPHRAEREALSQALPRVLASTKGMAAIARGSVAAQVMRAAPKFIRSSPAVSFNLSGISGISPSFSAIMVKIWVASRQFSGAGTMGRRIWKNTLGKLQGKKVPSQDS